MRSFARRYHQRIVLEFVPLTDQGRRFSEQYIIRLGDVDSEDDVLLVQHLVVLEVVQQRAGRVVGIGGEVQQFGLQRDRLEQFV